MREFAIFNESLKIYTLKHDIIGTEEYMKYNCLIIDDEKVLADSTAPSEYSIEAVCPYRFNTALTLASSTPRE